MHLKFTMCTKHKQKIINVTQIEGMHTMQDDQVINTYSFSYAKYSERGKCFRI